MNFYRNSGGHADVNVFMCITRFGKGGLFLAEKNDLFDQSGTKLRVAKKSERTGFDGESYYLLMRDHVLPLLESQLVSDSDGTSFEYMHDNAGIHVTEKLVRFPGRSVKKLLAERGIRIVDWPANSPDLNPVEHFWAALNRLVKLKLKRLKTLPKNKKEHWNLIKRCWARLDNEKVKTIFNSFGRRLDLVNRNDGDNHNRY